MISNVCVTRLDNSTVKVNWETDGTPSGVMVYAATVPDPVVTNEAVARVNGSNCVKISGLDPTRRYYFYVKPERGPGILAGERLVHLKGAVNFRDLGGYKAGDGRRVKWGRVFRSDHLSRLQADDRHLLERLGIGTVFDFRTPAEVEIAPDRLPTGGTVDYLHLPVILENFEPANAFERIKGGDSDWLNESFMIESYLENLEKSARVWGTVLRRLAAPHSRPLVFHCTGGKDRAGICAALLLLALGVDEETVRYDHGLSDLYNADRLNELGAALESHGIDVHQLMPYLKTPLDAMAAVLDRLNDRHGGAIGYLRTKGGLRDSHLRALKNNLLA